MAVKLGLFPLRHTHGAYRSIWASTITRSIVARPRTTPLARLHAVVQARYTWGLRSYLTVKDREVPVRYFLDTAASRFPCDPSTSAPPAGWAEAEPAQAQAGAAGGLEVVVYLGASAVPAAR